MKKTTPMKSTPTCRGLDEKDIEVKVENGVLTIKGLSVRSRKHRTPTRPDVATSLRTEPGFSGDVADRVSGIAQSTDLIKDGLPRAAMRLLDKVSMLRDLRRPPGPCAIVTTSSSLDSGNKARPVDRSARLSWVSIVSRKFCRRWKRSATCRA